MSTTYTYQIPFNNNLWKLVGTFSVIAIIGALVPFEFYGKRMTLTNNTLFYGGLLFAGIFLLVALILKMKSNNSKQNPYKIELTESTLQVPKGKTDVVKIPLQDIASAVEIGNKMNGGILQVKMKTNSVKPIYIQANGFETEEAFFEFEENLNKRI